MKKWVVAIASMLSVVALIAAGCAAPTPIAPTGKAVFVISDAAAEMGAVSSINVTIGSIEVHREGAGWITVSTEEQTYDLLELKTKGTAKLLVETDLEVGTYDQARLNISKVIIVDSSGSHEAKLPSNKLQLKGSFEVKRDATTTINFDFIADQSLHMTDEGRYILAPVIQLETRKDAEAEIDTNRKVQVSGGHIVSHARLGMDTEGNMDRGVVISPDAVLTIDVSGKVMQAKGYALVTGTIKSVDAEIGTITITTNAGRDITLYLASDSQLVVDGSVSTLAALKNKIGSKVRLQYNIETKAIVGADVGATAETSASLTLRGTVTAVNIPARTITITTESGTEVTLQVDRSVAALANLATKKGAEVIVEYDTSTGMVVNINVQAQPSVSVSGVGIIRYNNFEGGFYGIVSNGGERYDPINLAQDFQQDGLRIRFEARIRSDLASIHGWGTLVELTSIEKLKTLGVTISGTLKAVNIAAGTMTITTEAGTDIVLNVASTTQIKVKGAVTTLVLLVAHIGSEVQVEYNAETNVAIGVSVR